MSIKQVSHFIYASMLAGLITLAALILLPIDVTVQGDKIGPSPYRNEIDELYEITSQGLPADAPEWARLDVLREKNNIWFETEGSRHNDVGVREYLTLKSLKLSPLLVVIWLLSFIVLARRFRVKA